MKLNRIGENTVVFKNKPRIVGTYSVVGKKEGNGPFRDYFDEILDNDLCGKKSYERAERCILEKAIIGSIEKGQVNLQDIDFILGGDLLNQITSSSYSAIRFEKPFIGLYSACSTMSQSLALGACLVDGGYARSVICATVSHFSTAEKQYRNPLELGNQRPPVSQWTVTGSGSTILSNKGKGNYISMATFGKVTDYGIKDANNMGAAMAPAAMETMVTHFKDTGTSPQDYDLIVTGDLGKLGSEILRDLMEHSGYKLGENYCDCGQMIYGRDQKVFQGGSGAGCSASILNAYINTQITNGKYNKVLFMATGALLSPTSTQQGDSIPSISHAVVIERGENNATNLS